MKHSYHFLHRRVVHNHTLKVFIKRLFRREPVVSTIVTAGTVNILLGMAEGQALLAFFGVLVVSGTLANRGWQKYYRQPLDFAENGSLRYLPEQTSQSPLPLVELSSQRDRQRE
ncbi:MAG: hypothetical protein AAGD09_16985 [Cyanobacteria bacterium P01_F01_bin.56]